MRHPGGVYERRFLIGCILLCCGAWYLYGTFLLPPWRLFLHSDNVVPYLMTTQPWLLQDFYYWGASRFGAIYPVLWKSAGRYLFGTEAAAFYGFFFGFFFIGTAFWLATIRSATLRVIFCVIVVPLQYGSIDELLFPGHVYGTLYFFYAVATYVLLAYERLSDRQQRLLGVLCALAYWQHLLAGLVLGFLVTLKFVDESKFSVPALWRKGRAFYKIGLILLVPIEVTRSYARKWEVPVFLNFESWAHFQENILDFSRRGLSFHLGSTFGQSLVVLVLIAALWSSGVLVRARRRGEPLGFEQLFLPSVFWLTIAVILFFNSHSHYTENLRHERYFTFLVPLLLVALGELPRLLVAPKILKPLVITAFSVLAVIAGQWKFIDRVDSILDPGALVERTADFAKEQQRLDMLVASGCRGVVDTYWRSYVLVALSDGALLASAGDHIRNPVYLKQILNSETYCMADEFFKQIVQPEAHNRECSKFDFEYWLCKAKA